MPSIYIGFFEMEENSSYMKNIFQFNPNIGSNTDYAVETYLKKPGNNFIYSSIIDYSEKESKEEFNKSIAFEEFNDIERRVEDPIKEPKKINKNSEINMIKFESMEINYNTKKNSSDEKMSLNSDKKINSLENSKLKFSENNINNSIHNIGESSEKISSNLNNEQKNNDSGNNNLVNEDNNKRKIFLVKKIHLRKRLYQEYNIRIKIARNFLNKYLIKKINKIIKKIKCRLYFDIFQKNFVLNVAKKIIKNIYIYL